MDGLIPAVGFPPGEFLLDILNDREWSQVDFAEIIGRAPKTVSEIITGKTAITPTMAKDIAAATDTNPMFWMNLETMYRMHGAQEAPSPRIVRHARLRRKYPVRDMVLRGWIENSSDPEVLESQVLKFFGVPSLEVEPRLMMAVKMAGYPEDVTGALRAWLFRVKQIAAAMTVGRYSEAKLREAIPVLRQMLVSPDDIRRVPKLLADCGVRFVVVEHVPASKIDGVCFWLGNSGADPVIGMSLRLDRIDNFWFVLRHEVEHVLNGDGREVAMVDRDLGEVRTKGVSLEEIRADTAAADFCVPAHELNDFVVRHQPIFHEQHVVNFAQRMGVHPGLVVGQVQRKTGKWKLFRKHLVSVRPIISTVAMTDGYGQTISL